MVERGGKCNLLLDDLLKGLIRSATLPKIAEMLKVTIRDVKTLCAKNDCLKSYPNFNK